MPGDFFTRVLALLAFVVAFYALVARERKTPYATNFLYSSVLWIFSSLFVQLIAQLLDGFDPRLVFVLQVLSYSLLISGGLNMGYGIWRMHNRHVNFRDDIQLKGIAPIRKMRRWLLSKKEMPSYEFDAPKLLPDLKATVESSRVVVPNLSLIVPAHHVEEVPRCIVAHNISLNESDELIISLAYKLLSQDWTVQFTTCVRHPIELIKKLESYFESKSEEVTNRFRQIVVVDGYTPHFGFTDSIHLEMTASLKKRGIICVTSSPSFAGIHTATAQAFNKIKEKQGGPRRPTLVIYEGAFALTDLESLEQYRIFVRHVLPSERMWGGMLTFVIEPEIDLTVLPILKTYADVVIEKKGEDKDQPDIVD